MTTQNNIDTGVQIQQPATTSTWTLDPAHTLVEFSGKHMMFTTVKGHFKSVRGTIVLDEQDVSRSSVEAEIDTESLYSGVDYRDTHLKSADFLHIEEHPLITFKSTRVEPVGEGHVRVYGDLAIRGVTREVVLDTEVTGRAMNPFKKETLGIDAKTQINRKDFGLTWNMALESGGFLVGDTVKIELAIEAHRVEEAPLG